MADWLDGYFENKPILENTLSVGGDTTMAAQSVKVNNTGSIAAPVDLGLSPLQVVGTGSDGIVDGLGLDPASFEVNGGVLSTIGTSVNQGDVMQWIYKFSTGVVDNDPTQGRFKFDNALLGSVTKLWIDDLAVNGDNMEILIQRVKAGDKFLLMNQAGTSIHTAITIGGAATDKTGYWEWAATCAGGLATLPANLADVILVYVPNVMNEAILESDHFARFESDGAGGYRFIDKTGAVVTGVPAVYALASVPVSGVTTLPAASTFPLGTEVRIHPDCFVGTGHNPLGIKLVSDGTNWNPSGPQLMFRSRFGTIASPTLSCSTVAKFGIPAEPIIPYGLLRAESQIRFRGMFRKNGTSGTGPFLKAYLGTSATYTDNPIFYQQTITATTDDIDVLPDTSIIFITATTALSTKNAIRGGGGGANVFLDISDADQSFTADMIFSLALTAVTGGDVVDCIAYELWLE